MVLLLVAEAEALLGLHGGCEKLFLEIGVLLINLDAIRAEMTTTTVILSDHELVEELHVVVQKHSLTIAISLGCNTLAPNCLADSILTLADILHRNLGASLLPRGSVVLLGLSSLDAVAHRFRVESHRKIVGAAAIVEGNSGHVVVFCCLLWRLIVFVNRTRSVQLLEMLNV